MNAHVLYSCRDIHKTLWTMTADQEYLRSVLPWENISNKCYQFNMLKQQTALNMLTGNKLSDLLVNKPTAE